MLYITYVPVSRMWIEKLVNYLNNGKLPRVTLCSRARVLYTHFYTQKYKMFSSLWC